MPVPNFDGLEVIKYQLYEGRVGAVEKTLRTSSKIPVKTVFDPAKWNKERIATLAAALFHGKAPLKGNYLPVEKFGIKWEGFFKDGVLETFGAVL
jgi:hypothetical protein